VLDMVDYNNQNIFIDDCNITGFIDWDGMRAVPQVLVPLVILRGFT
jgi:hypothetical protein